MGDIRVEVTVLGVNICERDHRHEFGRRKGDAQGKAVGKRDAVAVPFGLREQTLFDLEALDKVPPFLFRRLKIVVFRVGQNEIER